MNGSRRLDLHLKIGIPLLFVIIVLSTVINYTTSSNLNEKLASAQASFEQTSNELELSRIHLNDTQAKLDANLTLLDRQKKFNHFYTLGNNQLTEANIAGVRAGLLYTVAGLYYEENNFIEVIQACVKAREFFGESSQDHKRSKASFEKALQFNTDENYAVLLGYLIKMNEAGSILQTNMYEACEYFESAANYYRVGDKAGGDSSINRMNDKIRSHDNQVTIYNDYLAKSEAQLELIETEFG